MNRISLKESLFLGFCAVFVLLSRGALRLHLGISGHVMFSTVHGRDRGRVRPPLFFGDDYRAVRRRRRYGPGDG